MHPQNHAPYGFAAVMESLQDLVDDARSNCCFRVNSFIVLYPKDTNSKTVTNVSIIGIMLTPWGA
jgi:hypothetical protein